MKNVVIKYGLISGTVFAVYILVGIGLLSDKMGFDVSEIIGYTSMIAAFLPVYFGMASYRDNTGAGRITFGRAISIGLLITVVASICYVITWVIVYHTMVPDFMDKYATHMIDKMKEKGASAADMDKQTAQLQLYKDMYKNPVTMCLLTFVEPLPVGVLISLISALIVRRKKATATV